MVRSHSIISDIINLYIYFLLAMHLYSNGGVEPTVVIAKPKPKLLLHSGNTVIYSYVQ